jgi:hypothetical protein
MNERPTESELRAHAELTRKLVARAVSEGNHALARELERLANDFERALREAA